MSHRVNLSKSKPNPELEKLLGQARKITSYPEQESEWHRKGVRLKTIEILLHDNPHQSRDYVTGIVDMLDRENALAKANPEPWEVAEVIADAVRSNKRGRDARIRALDWAADVAISLYPRPKEQPGGAE